MALSELLLVRHAKSDWGAGLPDADRPLSRRGEQAARTMGRVLALTGRAPDLMLTSPARRARLTADLAVEAGEWACPVVEDESLLPGSARQVIEAIQRHAGAARRPAVIGHEPALSQTAALLLGGASLRMVTGAAVCLEVGSWPELGPGSATLAWMLTPRLFTEGRFPL
jgi:phosphohistidine phosphatase